MNFFDEKIINITFKTSNHHLQKSKLSVNTAALEVITKPDTYLDSFLPISTQYSSVFSSSKSTTCLLDPIPSRLLKEVFPLLGTSLLDIINSSLTSGYVSKTFKVAVIKPH